MTEPDVAVADAIDAYLQRKAVGDPDGSGAGAYAANAESILRRWAEWLERDHGVRSLFALEADHLRAYAVELDARTERGQYTASTAGTYYAVVRAFLSWCVSGGILETNPAATDAAETALPTAEDHSTDSQWTATKRRDLERYVRERALETVDGASATERRSRLREYAMVAVLAHSGARGAELFRVPEDERRSGATWDDVDFYTGTIRVLGRSRRLEDVSLPAQVRTPLRRYRVVLDPPSNEWPLFPTRHAPSVAAHVRERLRARGYDEATIEDLFAASTSMELAREHDVAPPAITTEGARSVLERLCEEAGIDVDGDYLTLRDTRAERDGPPARREATASKPTLRASVLEQSIAVPQRRPPIVVEPVDESDEESDGAD